MEIKNKRRCSRHNENVTEKERERKDQRYTQRKKREREKLKERKKETYDTAGGRRREPR